MTEKLASTLRRATGVDKPSVEYVQVLLAECERALDGTNSAKEWHFVGCRAQDRREVRTSVLEARRHVARAKRFLESEEVGAAGYEIKALAHSLGVFDSTKEPRLFVQRPSNPSTGIHKGVLRKRDPA